MPRGRNVLCELLAARGAHQSKSPVRFRGGSTYGQKLIKRHSGNGNALLCSQHAL